MMLSLFLPFPEMIRLQNALALSLHPRSAQKGFLLVTNRGNALLVFLVQLGTDSFAELEREKMSEKDYLSTHTDIHTHTHM